MIKAPDFIAEYSINGWRNLDIVVVGAGGTGSALLNKLFQLQMTMKALGASGFNVTVFDDDVVSPSNLGRQAFWPVDLGMKKAEVLVDRYKRFGGINWTAVTERFESSEITTKNKIIFGCVDNVQGRKEIHRNLQEYGGVWVDCGNDSASANIFMGMKSNVDGKAVYLPTVYDLFKASMDDNNRPSEPSCSTAEAIARQSFGINDMTAAQAVQMLWQLIRHGEIAYQGITLDLKQGTTTPIEADKEIWAMFGYEEAA